MWWGDQDLVKLGIKEHKTEKETLRWAVPFTEMLNFLPLDISMCLCAWVPQLVHTTVYPELLQSHDLPHCPARSPSKQRPEGFVLAFKHTSLFHMLFYSGRKRTGRPWHLGNSSPPEKLPSLILTIHGDHTPLALLTVWLCHHTGQMSWADCQGRVLRGEKAETKETSIHRMCLVSSKQGVNASQSPHTGVVSQGQNWWLSRRESRKLSLFRKEDRGEKGLFSLLMNTWFCPSVQGFHLIFNESVKGSFFFHTLFHGADTGLKAFLVGAFPYLLAQLPSYHDVMIPLSGSVGREGALCCFYITETLIKLQLQWMGC